eukprot:23855-Prymnesium_polylepis.1
MAHHVQAAHLDEVQPVKYFVKPPVRQERPIQHRPPDGGVRVKRDLVADEEFVHERPPRIRSAVSRRPIIFPSGNDCSAPTLEHGVRPHEEQRLEEEGVDAHSREHAIRRGSWAVVGDALV